MASDGRPPHPQTLAKAYDFDDTGGLDAEVKQGPGKTATGARKDCDRNLMLPQVTILQWAIGIIITVLMGFILYILNSISKRLDKMDTKIDKLDAKIDKVKTNLEAKIDKLDAKIDNVKTNLEAKIDKLDAKIDAVSSKVTNLRVAFGTLLGSLNGPPALATIRRRHHRIPRQNESVSEQRTPTTAEPVEPRSE
ncbi:MAG: hypothetical protein LBR80_09295 [Deltaproteobacteria bacterium]|nr:hypothetical protein [Deltaproteobacteria bacterium]